MLVYRLPLLGAISLPFHSFRDGLEDGASITTNAVLKAWLTKVPKLGTFGHLGIFLKFRVSARTSL